MDVIQLMRDILDYEITHGFIDYDEYVILYKHFVDVYNRDAYKEVV